MRLVSIRDSLTSLVVTHCCGALLDVVLVLVLCVGAVHYGRNGHHVASLMHVDHTLAMWAFFDVYGSVQKIKLLGEVNSC